MTISFRIMVFITLAVTVIIPPSIKSINPTKLDDTNNHVGSLKDEIKCGSCPCGMTCYTSPPPPPPPPHKKSPPTAGVKCPPPPLGGSMQAPPDYFYVSGPPKDVYPVVQSISAACRSITVAPELLWLSGLLVGMLAILVNFIELIPDWV